MDEMIKKLSEIERSASAIISQAEAQKKLIDKEYLDKKAQFDEELEYKTMEKIRQIKEELEQSKASFLLGQVEGSTGSIASLKKEYEENHAAYAHEIFKRITEVPNGKFA